MFKYYCICRGAGMSKLLEDNPTMSDFRGNSKELASQLILFLQSIAQVRNSISPLTTTYCLFKYLTYFVNCSHFHLFRTGNNYLKSPCGYKNTAANCENFSQAFETLLQNVACMQES